MDKLRKLLDDLFKDRAGADELSLATSIIGLVLIVGATAFSNQYVTQVMRLVGILSLFLTVARISSKDKGKRYQENLKFKKIFTADPDAKRKREVKKAKERALKEKLKTHVMFNCPSCGANCFIPKGKGKVRITCPKCQNKFIGKS